MWKCRKLKLMEMDWGKSISIKSWFLTYGWMDKHRKYRKSHTYKCVCRYTETYIYSLAQSTERGLEQ